MPPQSSANSPNFFCVTPWKINIVQPTNHPFRKEHDLPNLHDYVPCQLIFRGVSLVSIDLPMFLHFKSLNSLVSGALPGPPNQTQYLWTGQRHPGTGKHLKWAVAPSTQVVGIFDSCVWFNLLCGKWWYHLPQVAMVFLAKLSIWYDLIAYGLPIQTCSNSKSLSIHTIRFAKEDYQVLVLRCLLPAFKFKHQFLQKVQPQSVTGSW